MANFFEELWTSVFTPGTTPTLLLATNATFGALQFLLLILLFATYSIHFLVLSILCAGLWYSINWFATEINIAQAKAQTDSKPHTSDSIDSDTETEEHYPTKEKLKSIIPQKDNTHQLLDPSNATTSHEDIRKRVSSTRRPSLGDSSGYISTDSEWEKVSEGDDKTI